MSDRTQPLVTGVWLPIVTPFVDGAVDIESYSRLLEYYLSRGVHGIIPLGTTGESPTIEDDEVESIVDTTVNIVAGRVPVYVGVGGNSTVKVIKSLQRLERYPFQGILSVCPYYNRPGETGMREHFTRIAAATDRKILIYNIPYRTGVNLSNDTVLALSEVPNIVGIKDSCANLAQSLDLLRRRPATFSVMTGEDALYYTMLAHGGRRFALGFHALQVGWICRRNSRGRCVTRCGLSPLHCAQSWPHQRRSVRAGGGGNAVRQLTAAL
jgi:4-hydroxy-tetrahydrodipicolinate synthase